MHKRLTTGDAPATPPRHVPAIGEGKRGESGHLAYLLRQANVAVRVHLERELAEFGVTQAQFAVLTMIAAYPGLSNADLARLTLLTPQTLSVTVANVRRDGLVVSRPHAIHGRIKTLALTDSGKATLARCRKRVNAIEKALVETLSATEEQAVRKWLAAVALTCTAGTRA
jgi:DNA-binding MarR family transcriptional regulator